MAGVGLSHVNILGVRFVAGRSDDVRAAIRQLLACPARDGAYLCPTGAHGVIEARKDPAFRRILNGATFNLPDGLPIVLLSRALGLRESERMFGPDVMWAVLTDSVELDVRHFYYGGREGVAERLAETVARQIPGHRVAGCITPPFRPLSEAESAEVAARINESGADVVWEGLSTPKQERWTAAMRERLSVKLICSVGAAFDYHTHSIRRAPRWMQALALEWLYRLAQEPRRLAGRYAEIVPKFALLSALQLSGLKSFPIDDSG
jgi:N-acetylglucosaminyldiphosphoundecaprenol N-acetyl-beta-D-mannosaminyltransferase